MFNNMNTEAAALSKAAFVRIIKIEANNSAPLLDKLIKVVFFPKRRAIVGGI